MLLTLIVFFIVLGLLIFVHEFGHFLAARQRGVKVEEFGFGFPPRIFGFKKGETTYSLNLIPLGGFVKIFGEKGEGKGEKGSFASRSILERGWIISAGVLMNMLLAFFLLSGGFVFGLPSQIEGTEHGRVKEAQIRIVSVLPSAPAFEKGIKLGDIVLSLDNNSFETIPEIQEYLKSKVGQPIKISLKRGKELVALEVVPEILPETKAGGIGVGLVKVGIVSYPLPQALLKAAQSTVFFTGQIIKALFDLLKNLISQGKVSVDLTGPIGVAVMTGMAARMGLAYLIQFVALLSINLAVVNFLPIPALDGGRVLFLVLEAIRKKAVQEKVENLIHNIGFILLLVLVVVITYRDLLRWGDKILAVVKKSVGL